jgi:hypothetical protein
MTPAGTAGPPTTAESTTNLADVLERVLDKGIVIVGDIRINLLDIELLTIKLRLIVAGVDTARRMGIDWWERDPWLAGREDEEDERSIRGRVARLERQLESSSGASLDDEHKELREQVDRLQRQLERSSKSSEARND